MNLFGVGRKIKFDNEGKTITIFEGQFSDNELHGVGRRVLINYAEEAVKFEQYIGEWSKGTENGYMNVVSFENKIDNFMYKEGLLQEGNIDAEEAEKLKFNKKRYTGLF